MDHDILEQLRAYEFNNRRLLLGDKRLAEIFHLRHHYELKQYASLAEWAPRREALRKQILVSAGLWPLPEKCDLRARIFDTQTFEGFTIEKVIFESYPGYYVTGNLYKPLGKAGPFPAILNAHGHWLAGRLEATDICNIPRRCANLARMGFVAFVYDMVGYQDSKQLEKREHFLHLAGEVDEAGVNIPYRYGNFPEELWGIDLFGLQLWNSMRSIDFVQSLPEVDGGRVGCTGASGGATQTIFISAVDERIKVAVPVNIISVGPFQWGCSCENAPNLWIGTNSVEIASMIAPRPLLAASCTGDSATFPALEHPAIRSIYHLYGAADDTAYFYDDAVHNYNKNTREAAYRWFSKYLLHKDDPWVEQEVELGDLSKLKISLRDVAPQGIQQETELIELMRTVKRETLQRLYSSESRKDKETLLIALQYAIGVPETQEKVCAVGNERTYVGDLVIEQASIGTTTNAEQIPLATVCREQAVPTQKAALVVHPKGRNRLFADGTWHPMLMALLAEGNSVVAPDVFQTSEFYDYCRLGRMNSVQVTYCSAYNRTDATLHVQDIITAYNYLLSAGFGDIELVGLGEAGAWCLAALPFLKDLKCAAIDCLGLEPDSDDWYVTNFFIPCFRAAGGLETAVRLVELDRLLLFNAAENQFAEAVQHIYCETDRAANVIVCDHLPDAWQARQ